MAFFLDRPLTKHIAAVHNCALLNATQRKIMNIFLSNALNGGENDAVHFISLTKIKESLGWSDASKTTDLLKEDLKDLAKTQIEWNVLNVDKKNKWTAMQLLSEISIEGSIVSYAYPPTLREMLFRPNIFAKLNMNVQLVIKKRNALVLWELLCGEFCLNKSESIVTKWFLYEEILKLNGLENSIYQKRYSEFLQKVVDTSVLELNEKSDISVSYEKKMNGRKIEAIRFIASKKQLNNVKNLDLLVFDEEEELKARFEGLGFNKRVIANFLKDYTKEELENALDVYYQQLREGDIKYPVGFFKKALDEGWIIKKEKEVLENKTLLFHDIYQDEDDPLINKIRTNIFNAFGDAIYKSWFSNVFFEFNNDYVVIVSPSPFHSDWIQNNYREKILRIVELLVGKKNVYFDVKELKNVLKLA